MVVVMDAASNKEPRSQRPYVELISTVAATVPGVTVFQEPITADWKRDAAVAALSPHLIIIHINGFSLVTNDAIGYTRYIDFMKRFRYATTAFILYSRSADFGGTAVSEYVRQQTSTDTGLPTNRLYTFALNRDRSRSDFGPPKGSFPDDWISSSLRTGIEDILKRKQ